MMAFTADLPANRPHGPTHGDFALFGDAFDLARQFSLWVARTSTPANPRTVSAWLRTGVVAFWLGIGLAHMTAADLAKPAPPTEIHFAFSKSMFIDLNQNDARAAMRVYAQTIGNQNGLYVDSVPELLDGTNEIAKALERGQDDIFTLTAEEFFALEGLGLEGPVLMSSINHQFTEEYVLLSRAEGSVRRVEDLQHRRLMVSNDVRSFLARPWLETLCQQYGLGTATHALAQITSAPKTTQVILPVFFGKADAAIVTLNAWHVMCELNPQLKTEFRLLASSPRVVPALSCFRHGVPERLKQQVLRALEMSSNKPSYSQLMVLFKSDDVDHQPVTALQSTRELVAKYWSCARLVNAQHTSSDSPAEKGELRSP